MRILMAVALLHMFYAHCNADLAAEADMECGRIMPGTVNWTRDELGILREAKYNEFPWMVEVFATVSFQICELTDSKCWHPRCGASLISLNVVLTTGSCVDGLIEEGLKARAGDWKLDSSVEPLPYQERRVRKMIIHNLFRVVNAVSKIKYNVALLVLDSPYDVADNIGYICLPPLDLNEASASCKAAGWAWNVQLQRRTIQVVNMEHLDDDRCETYLRMVSTANFISHDSFICVAGIGGEHTCNRDIGSSLMCLVNDHYYVRGLHSLNYGCGKPDTPGVYADLVKLKNWVDEQMRTNGFNTNTYTRAGESDMECGRIMPGTANWTRDVAGTARDAKYTGFPWMVKLFNDHSAERPQTCELTNSSCWKFVCGASLISLNVVLTSATCGNGISRTAQDKRMKARAGDWTVDELLPYQERLVSKIIVHNLIEFVPDYIYNVALLIVGSPYSVAVNIGYICLPPPDLNLASARCKAAIWGGQLTTSYLVDVDHIDRDRCQKSLRMWARPNYVVHDSFTCVSGIVNDTCRGEDGSPLLCLADDNYYARGLHAWGGGCGNANVSGVYADLVKMRNWVDETMRANGFHTNTYTYADKPCLTQKGSDGRCVSRANSSNLDETLGLSLPQQMCVLPEYPYHGKYTTSPEDLKPGDAVVQVSLIYTCGAGYSIQGAILTYCSLGFWVVELPTCEKQCAPLKSTSVNFKCYKAQSTAEVSCKLPQDHNSRATAKCKDSYHSELRHKDLICNNGSWNYMPFCNPDCGTVIPEGEELVIRGRDAYRTEFPWHVGLYDITSNPAEQLCGGSIFSANLVVSAAHCVYQDTVGPYPASRYAVAAGKLYRRWNAANDDENYVQKVNVIKIEIPENYKGAINFYTADIAVLVLEKIFVLSSFVRPICIKFGYNDHIYGRLGKVAGWGLTQEAGNTSRILQTASLPIVSFTECYDKSPEGFKSFITFDKICAGYTNGTAVCKGDSGGGLVFLHRSDFQQQYYLYGIVSTSPRNTALNSCSATAYSAFTDLTKQREWFEDIWSKHNILG